MTNKTVIIIGAGPAGLTAAYEFLDKTSIKPIILEASGGKKDYDSGSFSLSKPSLPKAIRVQGKTSWRSLIPKQFQGEIEASKPQSSADLGLDPQVPRYVPLRLHSSSSTLKGLKADR